MPANKRQFEVAAGGEEEHDLQPRDERELKRKRVVDDEDDEDDDDDDYDDGDGDDREDDGDAAHDESDLSSSSTEGAKEEEEEFVMINLSEIRKEVQCPICLGIIRKTRTVMECLHRFCRECIDKSMRLGNNECPACRTHCASRRSLRDDPNYDALIAALYPDIDEYEEEELAFNEEDKARNKQIQETIAQTVKIQSEVSGRKRSSKRAAAEIVRKSRLNLRDTPSRGKKNCRNEVQVCDNDDLSEDEKRDSSSADEHCYSEVKPKRSRRSIGARAYSQPSGSIDRGSDENGSDGTREHAGTVGGLVRASERLSWGKGGIRSHTRHGNGSGSSVKNARANRISKLVDHLRNSKENEDEMDMQLMLVPINEQTMPNLQQPHLSCKPSLSVGYLLQYVAVGTESQTEEIELYLVKELQPKLNPSISIDPSKDKLQVLNEEERLAGLRIYNFINGYVLLAYQRKLQADKS